MKSKSLSHNGEQPWSARSCRILQREQSGSSQVSLTEPCTIGDMSPHDHADSETDTAMPDDDDDIASLASQPSASLQLSSL